MSLNTIMDIRELFRYSDVCTKVLRETLRAHEDVFTTPFETLSKWNSIQMLLAHSIAAEERWIEMRIGGKELVYFETYTPTSVEAVFAKGAQVRANTYAFLETLDVGGLQRAIAIQLPHQNLNTTMTVEQILFHIVNHENYHRGQISMALQQMRVDPPNFDYCFYV